MILEEKSILECKTINSVRKIFFEVKEEISKTIICDVEKVKKVPNEKINHSILQAIVRVVGEYVQTNPITNMHEIAKIIQSAQITYQRASKNIHKISTWKENIENKIKKYEELTQLLEAANQLKKLDKNDKTKAQTFLSQQKLKIGNKQHTSEGIIILKDKIQIYKKRSTCMKKEKNFQDVIQILN
ncbi:hypothetical protein BDAP_001265 [Binucleata daphniae]